MDDAARTLDLTPLAARQAIGRESGLRRVTARPPLWRTAGVLLAVATVASVTAPALFHVLTLTG